MEGVRKDAQGPEVARSRITNYESGTTAGHRRFLAPTQYPTWRSFAFAIVILQALGFLVLGADLIGRGSVAFNLSPSEATALRVGGFCYLLILIGTLGMIRRPAWGFLIFGAGALAGAVSAVVLAPWNPEYLGFAAAVLLTGATYTWLGFRQLAKDRA